MVNKPVVTVVIPTRNRCALLKETVAGVIAQTFDNWELIIVDDASEDETWSWLEGLNDARVRRIRLEQHAERTKARNIGLGAARGQFILFLDDDDLLTESALQTHVETLERYPTAIASISGYIMFDESGARQTVRIIRRGTVRHIWSDILFGWVAVSGQCLFRTQFVKSVNGWDVSYTVAEDHELWLRIGRLGPVALLPDKLLMYRVHSGQWRPRNVWQIMNETREQVVRQMHGEERQMATRTLQARALDQVAFDYYIRAQAAKALIFYIKTLLVMPSLLRSPLTRPMVLVPMMKCLVGKIGLRVGRRLFSWTRRMLKKKAIDLSVCTVVDSDQRYYGTQHSGSNDCQSAGFGGGKVKKGVADG